MYDPDTVSTPKKTQYGKAVNVGKLCEDTIMKHICCQHPANTQNPAKQREQSQ